MKLIASKSAIESAAVMLSKIINPKNSLPILADIHCEVMNNQMTMTASDSETTISRTIDLDTMEGEGCFCVPAVQLVNALQQLPEQPVTILATIESNYILTLQYDQGETYFPIDHAEDYPMPTPEQYTEQLELEAGTLSDALKRCSWCTANDLLRVPMQGVYFGLKGGLLDIAATDAYRIALSVCMVNVPEDRESSFIMPRKVAAFLPNILDYNNVTLQWNDRYCTMTIAPYTLTFRLVEGKFPNYDAIIPKDTPLNAVVSRSSLVNAIKNVFPFSEENVSGRVIRFDFNREQLRLRTQSISNACGSEYTIEASFFSDDFTIGFSGKGIMSILSHVEDTDVAFGMTDEKHVALIQPTEQPSDCTVYFVISPVMLNSEED